MPQLFDPMAVYRQMGLIADPGPIPIVGSVRVLAGPTPDSIIALVALSMHNHGLVFRREADAFVAEYRVELVFRQGSAIAQQVAREERVRVQSFRETQRSDESIIFQQFVPVAPGQYVLAITVRDRNGPNATHYENVLTVNALRRPAISTPIAVYQAQPRGSLAAPPTLVANPRFSVEYGTDSLRLYVETYSLPAGSSLSFTALDAAGRVAWADTTRRDTSSLVWGTAIVVPPGRLSIGRYDLKIALGGGDVIAQTPFLVSFSDRWAVANLEEVISLLRYFASPDTLRALLATPPEERGAAWQRFWKSTDPNPATPENEALDQYFARLQAANEQFREEGIPGWLTERGEVFINLGDPDDVVDRRPDIQGRGRVLFWVYNQYGLTLTFVDDTGFGRFRLDPRSRSEYLRVLNRVRRST